MLSNFNIVLYVRMGGRIYDLSGMTAHAKLHAKSAKKSQKPQIFTQHTKFSLTSRVGYWFLVKLNK